MAAAVGLGADKKRRRTGASCPPSGYNPSKLADQGTTPSGQDLILSGEVVCLGRLALVMLSVTRAPLLCQG